MPAKNSPESKGRDVSQCRRKNDVTNKAIGIPRVRDESEMTEHPADVNKTNNGKGYALQLAASAVPQNWNQQDQSHRERRHGDEECVPTGTRFFATRIRN